MNSEYHKIDSVYLRDPENNWRTFLDGQWSRPEFGYLAGLDWVWTEKIDGTNIRVSWCKPEPAPPVLQFSGRTNAAHIPAPLVNRLNELFTNEIMDRAFPDLEDGELITLYGEGYGKGIQKGGDLYKPNGVDFILFDVRVGDLWLKRDAVESVARNLGIDIVPVMSAGSLLNAIELVRGGFDSVIAAVNRPAEGLVVRPAIELLDRQGRRIITKIKTRDFQS